MPPITIIYLNKIDSSNADLDAPKIANMTINMHGNVVHVYRI